MPKFEVQGTVRYDYKVAVEAADAETAQRLIESEEERVSLQDLIGDYAPDVDFVEEIKA